MFFYDRVSFPVLVWVIRSCFMLLFFLRLDLESHCILLPMLLLLNNAFINLGRALGARLQLNEFGRGLRGLDGVVITALVVGLHCWIFTQFMQIYIVLGVINSASYRRYVLALFLSDVLLPFMDGGHVNIFLIKYRSSDLKNCITSSLNSLIHRYLFMPTSHQIFKISFILQNHD